METLRQNEEGIRLIIAGGGTGGHLFPAVAIAEEFLKRDSRNCVLFIGTEKGLEGRILSDYGYQLRTIEVEGIRGKGIFKSIIGISRIPKSIFQSRSIIQDFAPHIVLGVGGYASGPAVMAAHFMGIKTAIAEQNILPGFTNRILGRFVEKVFLTHPDRNKFFQEKKVIVTGNPVRADIWGNSKETRENKEKLAILVFGGSQGASSINRAVTESITFLKGLRDNMLFMHQTGEKNFDEVSKAYRDNNMDADVLPFIIDMARAYRWADLVICRAGATSVAEITAMGRASILIPYPHAVGNHQVLNAQVLHDAGATHMILEDELTGERLANLLKLFHSKRNMITEMEIKSKKLGKKKAAADIVDGCLALQGV
ncbi:MAG: undecaprenyldiphospho-muramoylpentapeptide beta-N-acetylglucosaminyltransferase [Deltaproteobacteria bacterium]|nr:undecaprenyldiphospho-muramoylpentapeptide beta-N-acetylglucosaminyltransferase [Deltaproteobacteria bacterium]